MHGIPKLKGHVTEHIPEGVTINAMCPFHKKNALEMFCVDEKKLCCPECVVDKLHNGHKVVKVAEIAQDNEIFSVEEVRKGFFDIIKRDTMLDKKIEEVIERIEKETVETRVKILKTFEKKHQELSDEENRLMKELEKAYNEVKDALEINISTLRGIREYSSVLSRAETEKTSEKRSRLMELSIASEMEEQRKEIDKLLRTRMRDLKIEWNGEMRKLSFTKNSFSGEARVKDVSVKAVSWNELEVSWETSDEEKDNEVKYSVEIKSVGWKKWKEVKSGLEIRRCRIEGLNADSMYDVRVKCFSYKEGSTSELSDVVRGRTLKWGCMWRESPCYIEEKRKYVVGKDNYRIAAKINGDGWCTIIGDTIVPFNTVTSWSIKVLKSRNNNGNDVHIGVAPFDIDQNACNYNRCGWYFYCGYSGLWSGPPQYYEGKAYGPRKGTGQYVHTGDSVGVVIDTAKGNLSFILDNVNLGVAYGEIPLDKPLVPCVLLRCENDSIDLII